MRLNYILCQTIFITFQFILYFIKQTYLAKKKKERKRNMAEAFGHNGECALWRKTRLYSAENSY